MNWPKLNKRRNQELVAFNPKDDPTNLANILLAKGWVTEEQIKTTCFLQGSCAGQEKLIGQILVEHGYVSKDRLETALLFQKIERNQITPAEAVKSTMEYQSTLRNKATTELRSVTNAIKDLASESKRLLPSMDIKAPIHE